MNLEINEIIIADHYALISSFMKPLHVHEHELFDKTAPWEEIEHNYMQAIIGWQDDNDGTCLVAYVDGVPAGFMFGYAEEPDESRIEIYTGPEFYVSDGYIDPAFRRMGIYKRMNEYIENLYISRGVKRLTRFTHINNHQMQQFLEGEGYKPTRVLYEKWLD